MRALLPAAACALSLLALYADGYLPERLLPPELPRLGLVLLPWIALCGLPRMRCQSDGERAAGILSGLALHLACAAPAVVLALRLDAAVRLPTERLALAAGTGLALLALLTFSAELARRSPLAYRVHGALWLAAVPGALLLQRTVASFTGDAPAGLDRLAAWSPLGWVLDWSAAAGLPVAQPQPIGALGAALLLVLLTAALGRGGTAEESR